VSLSRQEKRSWLEQVPLFRGCDAETLDRLADVTAALDFADGQVIVQQGQVGNGLYIVVSGGVRILAGDDELARLGPGRIPGELSVIDGVAAASALADGATACLALASWDLIAMLQQDSDLAMNLLRELAGRLRRADAQLRN
jgi:CRP/FNR family transcriptional regulator